MLNFNGYAGFNLFNVKRSGEKARKKRVFRDRNGFRKKLAILLKPASRLFRYYYRPREGRINFRPRFRFSSGRGERRNRIRADSNSANAFRPARRNVKKNETSKRCETTFAARFWIVFKIDARRRRSFERDASLTLVGLGRSERKRVEADAA